MDEQTRLAKFESMRKQSNHKQLFLNHQELAKHRDRVIRRYALDAKVATSDIQRQQYYMELKKEKLKKDKKKLELRREKTHTYFRRIDSRHLERERTFKYDFTNPSTNRFQLDRILGKLFTLPSIATNDRANKG